MFKQSDLKQVVINSLVELSSRKGFTNLSKARPDQFEITVRESAGTLKVEYWLDGLTPAAYDPNFLKFARTGELREAFRRQLSALYGSHYQFIAEDEQLARGSFSVKGQPAKPPLDLARTLLSGTSQKRVTEQTTNAALWRYAGLERHSDTFVLSVQVSNGTWVAPADYMYFAIGPAAENTIQGYDAYLWSQIKEKGQDACYSTLRDLQRKGELKAIAQSDSNLSSVYGDPHWGDL